MSDLTPIPPGILLCAGCGARLASSGGLPAGSTPLCPDCAEERASTRRFLKAPVVSWVSIREEDGSAPEARRLHWVWPAAAAVIVAVLAVVLSTRKKDHKPAPPVAAAPAPVRPAPPAVAVPEDPALKAKKEAEALRLRRIAELKEDLGALDQETAGLESGEEFQRLLELLARSKDRHAEEPWTAGIAEREAAVRAKAEGQFAAIRGMALETREAGDKAKLRERVAKWALPGYAEELEKALGSAPPAPPPPPKSREAQAYREEWERVMARAAARDYDRALLELRKAAKGAREDEVRREAATDLDDLEKVKLLQGEVARILAKGTRGAPMTLQIAAGRVVGVFVSSDGDRIELRTAGAKETVFVEVEDLAAASVASIAKGKTDARTLALFCLIEGHAAGARVLLSRLDDAPAKYWAWAGTAKARALPPDVDAETQRRERSARDLYVAAEREYRSMTTRAMAVQRYRSLASGFQDTILVRHAAAKIARRTEGCSEYSFLPADLRAGGTFKKGDPPAGGTCWTSTAESEFSRGNENFVEVEFCAMEGETYRCWLQAGACCQETFQAFFQVTDLIVPHPTKPKQTALASPGTLFAVAVAPPAGTLPATHAAHGGPKTPTTWGWIEVPLARFATPGVKRIRLLTAQKGFSVARAVVSSSRVKPPSESELEELDRLREPLDLPPLPADDGLVAAWSFDETVEDLSPNGLDVRLPLTASWDAGKAGRALALRGDDGARVDDSPKLRLAGDLTISFWLKLAPAPDEKALLVGKGGNYRLFLVAGRRIVFEQRDDADQPVLTVSPLSTLELGRWIHVAVVVRGGHGSVYLDGRPEAAKGRSGAPGGSEAPLVIGEGLSGLIDELRIHSKALPSDEIAREAQR